MHRKIEAVPLNFIWDIKAKIDQILCYTHTDGQISKFDF